MNTQLRRSISAFIIALVLPGCAGVVVFVDRPNSILMPDHVARKTLAKYFGEDWAQSPYLEPLTHALLFCNLAKVPVNFTDIKQVYYFAVLSKKVELIDNGQRGVHAFDCGYDFKQLTISVSSELDAQQITEALIALGAPIGGYVKVSR